MASLKQNTLYSVNKQFTGIEADLRKKILKEVAYVNEYYRDGSPKSATAIIVEVMAIIKGNN